MINIDYQKIADAIKYYSKKYQQIETPWWVSQEIMDITKPKDANGFYIPHNKKSLVGSGEQAFLYMANKGRLLPGKYLTTTPCFRDEPIGKIHKKCFIKTELIDTKKVNSKQLKKMIDFSLIFFSQYFDKNILEIIQTDVDAYDIQVKIGEDYIELGSYGIRSCEFLDWIYGTACAEPRLSRALHLLEYYNR